MTLKEVQLRLGVPQHVLIHLCEKGVILPDFSDTSGRGKRREFSARNLLEFGIALALRAFEVPVATGAFVVRLLRSFERTTAKLIDGFTLTDFLLEKGIELVLHFYDGHLLVVSMRGGPLRRPLLLAAKMGEGAREPSSRIRLEKLDALPSEFDARLELDVTRIAKRVFDVPLSN